VRRHNDRPLIRASELSPSAVSIVEGQRTMVLCPESVCDRWVYVQRGAIKPHHVTHKVRCAGSGQRIKIDLTEDEHLALLYKAHQAVDARRVACVRVVAAPALRRMSLAAA
jgi:hypothetical protein